MKRSVLFATTLFTMSLGIWVNEIHYANTGGDRNEMVEIIARRGTSLENVQVTLYRGSDGKKYDTKHLSGIVRGQSNGYGYYVVEFNTILNGPRDGIALTIGGNVIEFLSYGGTFTATNGPANKMTSTDIGTEENKQTNPGFSLQRIGTGTKREHFTVWECAENTFGFLNTAQTVLLPSPSQTPSSSASTTVEITPSASISPSMRTSSSVTPSSAISNSIPPSGSATTTTTPTSSASETMKISPSISSTPSMTMSSTVTPSPTISLSPSPSISLSSTPSISTSPSTTISSTATPSPTVSTSSSVSVSTTPSSTASQSLVITPSTSTSPSTSMSSTTTPSPSISTSPTASSSIRVSPTPSFSKSTSPSTLPSSSPRISPRRSSSTRSRRGGKSRGHPFIDEIRYWNRGRFRYQSIDITGRIGTDLSEYSLVLYSRLHCGGGGSGILHHIPRTADNEAVYGLCMYRKLGLKGKIEKGRDGWGTERQGILSLNGGTGGVALIKNDRSEFVTHFFSFAGTGIAQDGPAKSLRSINVGKFEGKAQQFRRSLRIQRVNALNLRK